MNNNTNFARDFLALYDEHEDAEWSVAFQALAERARALSAAAKQPEAAHVEQGDGIESVSIDEYLDAVNTLELVHGVAQFCDGCKSFEIVNQWREETNAGSRALTQPVPAAPGAVDALRERLSKVIAGLQFNRETHVVWRDWLAKSPDNEKVNPHAGNEKFHADTVLEYDGHIATIQEAIAALAQPDGARMGGEGES